MTDDSGRRLFVFLAAGWMLLALATLGLLLVSAPPAVSALFAWTGGLVTYALVDRFPRRTLS